MNDLWSMRYDNASVAHDYFCHLESMIASIIAEMRERMIIVGFIPVSRYMCHIYMLLLLEHDNKPSRNNHNAD